MSSQTLKPVLKQLGQLSDDFQFIEDTVAGIRVIPECVSVYIEQVGDKYRAVAFFELDGIESQKLSGGQSVVFMHPEELAFRKAGPSLQKELRDVRDWLGEGDCDPSFSDPIDEALNMVEPHMERPS